MKDAATAPPPYHTSPGSKAISFLKEAPCAAIANDAAANKTNVILFMAVLPHNQREPAEVAGIAA